VSLTKGHSLIKVIVKNALFYKENVPKKKFVDTSCQTMFYAFACHKHVEYDKILFIGCVNSNNASERTGNGENIICYI
jgi:hypothetical protein